MNVASGFSDLPAEIAAVVAGHVHDRKDLKACRLTCRALSAPATRKLFQTVILWATNESAERAEHILHSKTNEVGHSLRKYVRSLVIFSLEQPDDSSDPGLENYNWIPPKSYFAVLTKMCRLVNLKRIHVIFSKYCAVDDRLYPKEIHDTPLLRKNLLIAFFKAMNKFAEANDRQVGLTLENLQNVNSLELVEKLPEFRRVLSNLVEFHLGLSTEYESSDESETVIGRMELVNFFQEPKGLQSIWLEPIQNTVTRLSLHCDVDWGFIPKFNPAGLIFKNLRFLSLGNWIFSRNSDLEWIQDHRATLEELIFADCAIIFHVSIFADQLYQHHPILDDMNEIQSIEASGGLGTTILTYETRWHQVFDQLGESLLKLRCFQMISLVDREEHLNSISVDYEFAGQSSDLYINQIRPERYATFDSRMGPNMSAREEEGPEKYQIKSKSNGKLVVVYDKEFNPKITPYERHWSTSTAYYDLDTAALEHLLSTISKRATESAKMEAT